MCSNHLDCRRPVATAHDVTIGCSLFQQSWRTVFITATFPWLVRPLALVAMSSADHYAKPGVVAQSPQAGRAAQAVQGDRRATELARGVARLTLEDSRLAASLRGLALPVARRLVDDPGRVWERTVDGNPRFSTRGFHDQRAARQWRDDDL